MRLSVWVVDGAINKKVSSRIFCLLTGRHTRRGTQRRKKSLQLRDKSSRSWRASSRHMVQAYPHSLKRGVLLLKHREFVLRNPHTIQEHELGPEFLMHLQRAVLLSLEKRNLLTASQVESCLSELEKQCQQAKKNTRK